jgi:glycine cleavage system H lipoate-binding protein
VRLYTRNAVWSSAESSKRLVVSLSTTATRLLYALLQLVTKLVDYFADG